jgi:RNA polymerase sigma factor (sigma-70 family)
VNRLIRNKLVVDNMGLVYSFVRERFPGKDEADLIQAGMLGLIQAVEEYDPRKGSLATIAHYKMLHQIQKCIRQSKGQTSSKSAKETTLVDQCAILGVHVLRPDNNSQKHTGLAISDGGLGAVESRLDLAKLSGEVSDMEFRAMVGRMDSASGTELAEVFAMEDSRQSRQMAEELSDIALAKARRALTDD